VKLLDRRFCWWLQWVVTFIAALGKPPPMMLVISPGRD
jgi:hypothetical protein